MSSAGKPGTLISYFTEEDPLSMAKEVEAAAKEYQRLYGSRPDFVAIHRRIGMALEPHLTSNFFSKDHQIHTRWHDEDNQKRITLGGDTS